MDAKRRNKLQIALLRRIQYTLLTKKRRRQATIIPPSGAQDILTEDDLQLLTENDQPLQIES